MGTLKYGQLDRSGCKNPTNTHGIYYENKQWKFVYEKVEPYLEWGLNTDVLQIDVPDGTATPFPVGLGINSNETESIKRILAADDFNPDETGRNRRISYWSKAITERHELFHSTNWPTYYYPELRNVESNIETQTVAVTTYNLQPTAVLNGKKAEFNQDVEDAFSDAENKYKGNEGQGNDHEDRAYLDGKSSYEALIQDIQGN